jgi:hypothetical protein
MKVDPSSPPTLQISPFPLKPAEFACRLGNGRLGGEVTQVPPGQALKSTSSTSLVESKKALPCKSPPNAYNLFVVGS